ncbi:MAG: adenylate/guanylate cyclase domain-containing protein [Dehalococcoidia bacterium]|nr:adenylate/guanylate cyclase domain-containing protein [Dehalococcoidia bacterium]
MELASPERTERWRATFDFARSDWDIFTVRILSESFDLPGSEVRTIADAWRRTTQAADFIEAWNPWGDDDVSELLGAVTAPTLVLQRSEDGYYQTLQDGIRVASEIPGARLAAIPGMANFPYTENVDAILEEVGKFLKPESAVPMDPPPSPFQTILFTDLESSTALTQRVGDEAAQEVLRGHNTTVRKALEAHGGREVKHTGDGIMAAFPSAVRAVEAALQVQRELAGGEVRVRIGLNAGEPIAEDDDLFGTAVQLAARICDRAEPGQVLVSRVVADLCAGKKLQFSHHSDATLKGFAEPVALFEVAS